MTADIVLERPRSRGKGAGQSTKLPSVVAGQRTVHETMGKLIGLALQSEADSQMRKWAYITFFASIGVGFVVVITQLMKSWRSGRPDE